MINPPATRRAKLETINTNDEKNGNEKNGSSEVFDLDSMTNDEALDDENISRLSEEDSSNIQSLLQKLESKSAEDEMKENTASDKSVGKDD